MSMTTELAQTLDFTKSLGAESGKPVNKLKALE